MWSRFWNFCSILSAEIILEPNVTSCYFYLSFWLTDVPETVIDFLKEQLIDFFFCLFPKQMEFLLCSFVPEDSEYLEDIFGFMLFI